MADNYIGRYLQLFPCTSLKMFVFVFQDIPKPLFMSTKEPNDWTEDEQKLAKEYEKRVKELQEEREKYRKVSAMRSFRNLLMSTKR